MKKKIKKTGLPPGSIIYTGNKGGNEVFIHHLRYNSETYEDNHFNSNTDFVLTPSLRNEINWYDVRGLNDTKLIETMGSLFGIHPLVLESISDVNQRPKIEEYEQGLFIVFKALTWTEDKKLAKEQVAIFFREDLVLSFQENESDLLESVRLRIQKNKGRICKKGADYLAYSLLDLIADNYFIVLDQVEAEIEKIESKIIDAPNQSNKSEIHLLKKELLDLRKAIAPFREIVSKFLKMDSPFVDDNTLLFIRDLYDHSVQILDITESYRDMLNGLQDLYLSELSFKMNQVMQLLTLISVVFIPLTFLAGIYGMNFSYIPELQWKYGYFALWALMICIFIGQLFYFKKRDWL